MTDQLTTPRKRWRRRCATAPAACRSRRYSVSFLPCGSGGRALAGDDLGAASRVESPFKFGVTREVHDFAWRKKGVCYYCIDCCVVMQQMPIDFFGYPVRVVEPPTYPARSAEAARCTWHVYKDIDQIPETAYEEVGRTKPDPRTESKEPD